MNSGFPHRNLWDGKGDVSVCSYYDDLSKQNPECGYFKEAAKICRGEKTIVNIATTFGIGTSRMLTGRTSSSQSSIMNNIRNGLIKNDVEARNSGQVDGQGCTCGDNVDDYHKNVFEQSGVDYLFYGGTVWPQNTAPNPVPYDSRGSDPIDDAFN